MIWFNLDYARSIIFCILNFTMQNNFVNKFIKSARIKYIHTDAICAKNFVHVLRGLWTRRQKGGVGAYVCVMNHEPP